MFRQAHFYLSPGLRDMMGASFLFALMAAFTKEVQETLPIGYPIFARSIIGLFLSYLLIRRLGLHWRGNRPKLLALRGLMGFTALVLTFASISRLPLSIAAILQQTQPIWTALFAALFLKERLSPSVIFAVIAALFGVILVVDPTVFLAGAEAQSLDPIGIAFALIAALLAAGAYTSVRALRRTDAPAVVVFWFALVATPGSFPTLIAEPIWPSLKEWLLLLAIGLSVQGAQLLMTRAYHREAASRVATIGYLQVVYTTLFGVLFFNERLSLSMLFGAALIIASALTLTLTKSKPMLDTDVEAD